MLRFRTFGRVELVTGDPPTLRTVPTQPKRLAVLAYLAAATPRGLHRRDTLLALFWPELNVDEGRRALRQALHALRRWLGESALVSTPDDRIGLADGGVWCDAVAFEQALDDGRAADALAVYDGDFFLGTFIADTAPAFEHWVDDTRRRLRDRATSAATALSATGTEAGDYVAAVRWAEAACRLAPEDEPALRNLLRALDRGGDRPRAWHAYQAFARRLADDLGVTPAPETTALAKRLCEASAPLPALTVAPFPAPTVAPLPSVTPSPSPILDVPLTPTATGRGWGRPRRLVLAAAALAVVAAGIAWIVWSSSQLVTLGPSDRLIIADFRDRTRDSLLGGAVTEAVGVDLAQSNRVRVLSRAQVQTVLGRMERKPGEPLTETLAREVSEREGIKAFVAGDVAALGTGYTISARLVSAETGDVLVAERETARDSTRLLEAVDAVSRRLRRRVGESLWSTHASPPLEQVTTGSLEALRRYSQAIRVGELQGDDRRAIGILQDVVALDPHFAMAYRRLGVYYNEYGETARANDALHRAFLDRDRLSERERGYTMGSYYMSVVQPERSIAAYRTLLDRYPGDWRALNNIGQAYSWLKNFHEAARYCALAVAADSSVALLYNHLATAQYNAADYDAAARTLAVRARMFPPQANAERIAIALLVARGEWLTAERHVWALLEAAGPDAGERALALQMLAALAVRRGRLSEAERLLHALLDVYAAQGLGSDYVNWSIFLGFVDIWYRHAPERGVGTIQAAVARFPLQRMSPLDRPTQFLAYAYALAGRPSQARAVLADVRAVDSAAGWGGTQGAAVDGGYGRALGAIELAEGRFAMARAELRRADRVNACTVCTLPDLARAYELTGAPDSAIATYTRYLSTPWSEWQAADGEFRGTAYARLGALDEQRGDSSHAVAAYTELVRLWTTADPELQPEVARAKERLAALESPPKVAGHLALPPATGPSTGR